MSVCFKTIILLFVERRWWFFIFRRTSDYERSRSSLCWDWHYLQHPAYWFPLPYDLPTHTRYACTCKFYFSAIGSIVVPLSFYLRFVSIHPSILRAQEFFMKVMNRNGFFCGRPVKMSVVKKANQWQDATLKEPNTNQQFTGFSVASMDKALTPVLSMF